MEKRDIGNVAFEVTGLYLPAKTLQYLSYFSRIFRAEVVSGLRSEVSYLADELGMVWNYGLAIRIVVKLFIRTSLHALNESAFE